MSDTYPKSSQPSHEQSVSKLNPAEINEAQLAASFQKIRIRLPKQDHLVSLQILEVIPLVLRTVVEPLVLGEPVVEDSVCGDAFQAVLDGAEVAKGHRPVVSGALE